MGKQRHNEVLEMMRRMQYTHKKITFSGQAKATRPLPCRRCGILCSDVVSRATHEYFCEGVRSRQPGLADQQTAGKATRSAGAGVNQA